MKRLILVLLLIAACTLANAQKLGDAADVVNALVGSHVREYYNASGYHQVRMDNKVVWENGHIKAVLLQQENVPSYPKAADFKITYLMQSGLLNRIYKEYFNY